MPSPPTLKAPEKVTVVPGEGRKVPLRIPGTSIKVPAEGMSVVRSRAVNRLLLTGDLLEQKATVAASSTPASSSATTTSKSEAKEG